MGAYEAVATEGRLVILPRTINAASGLNRVSALITINGGARAALPGIDGGASPTLLKDDIDSDFPIVLYPGAIEAVRQVVRPAGGKVRVLAVFDKSEVLAGIDGGPRPTLPEDVTCIGRFKSGEYFYGTCAVRIIDRGKNKN